MQDPLKQGLKRKSPLSIAPSVSGIRMQDPLKQGLKRLFFWLPDLPEENSNARSIKTRIETFSLLENLLVL